MGRFNFQNNKHYRHTDTDAYVRVVAVATTALGPAEAQLVEYIGPGLAGERERAIVEADALDEQVDNFVEIPKADWDDAVSEIDRKGGRFNLDQLGGRS